MQNPLIPVKNFVVRNQTRILAVTTVASVTVVAIQARGIKQHNDFLEEKGLTDEFYSSIEA